MSTIHAAQVLEYPQTPKYVEIPAPPPPRSSSSGGGEDDEEEEEVQIKVRYVGIHQLVRGRAAGKHYTSGPAPQIPGVDGVGTIVPTGEPVYFVTLKNGSGSLAELVNVPKKYVVVLPEGADLKGVAALGNAVLASWMGLRTRTEGLKKGFTAVVLGATGVSGKAGVGIARVLGAGKVIGMARNATKLNEIPGLDKTIVLGEGEEKTDYSGMGQIDVVLDYLWGPPALSLMASLKPGNRVQWIQVGSIAGLVVEFPAAILRSKDITLRGTGPGSWTWDEFGLELQGMAHAAAKLEPPNMKIANLKDIEKAWSSGGERLVIEI